MRTLIYLFLFMILCSTASADVTKTINLSISSTTSQSYQPGQSSSSSGSHHSSGIYYPECGNKTTCGINSYCRNNTCVTISTKNSSNAMVIPNETKVTFEGTDNIPEESTIISNGTSKLYVEPVKASYTYFIFGGLGILIIFMLLLGICIGIYKKNKEKDEIKEGLREG